MLSKYQYEVFFAVIYALIIYIFNQHLMPGAPHSSGYAIVPISSYAFGVLWIILYLSVGAGFGYLYRHAMQQRINIALFLSQFLLNLLWSPLLFYLKRVDLALTNLVVIWVIVGVLVFRIYKNKCLAWLFLPYFLALTHALLLSISLLFTYNQLQYTRWTIIS